LHRWWDIFILAARVVGSPADIAESSKLFLFRTAGRRAWCLVEVGVLACRQDLGKVGRMGKIYSFGNLVMLSAKGVGKG
jgi:hypothetical protein